MSQQRTVHVLIDGRVQGVGYRAWCARQAGARGLSGWVRNLKTGLVEAVFTGPEDAVASMLGALWQGPDFSKVTSVSESPHAIPQAGPFEVRGTV